MHKDWLETELGEVAEVIMGRQLSPSKKLGLRPRPYLRAANIGSWGISLDDVLEMDFTEDEERHFATEVGDILLVEGGNEKSVGCPALVGVHEANLCIQNTVIRCRVRDQTHVIPEFLFQTLRHSFWLGQFGQLCAGTTIMHLGQKRAEVFPISLPPVAVQRRIVDLVSSVDSYIAALQQQADAARVARSAVLRELLSIGGEDWTETTLGEVATWGSGGTPLAKTQQYYDGDIPWCVIGDLTEGLVVATDKSITSEGLASSSAKMIEPGTVMIAMYGASIGRTGIAGVRMSTNQAIAFASCNNAIVDNMFLLFYLQSQKNSFVQAGQGAAQLNISQTVLKRWPIKLPSLVDQQHIVNTVSSIDEVIQSADSAIADAKSLRSGLLSDLLSGAHEIPESYDRLLGAA